MSMSALTKGTVEAAPAASTPGMFWIRASVSAKNAIRLAAVSLRSVREHLGRDQVLRRQTRIDGEETHEAPDEQPGRDQQDERQ